MKKLFALISLLGLVAGMGGALNAQEEIVLSGNYKSQMTELEMGFTFSGTANGLFIVDWGDASSDTICSYSNDAMNIVHTYNIDTRGEYGVIRIRINALNDFSHVTTLSIDSTYKYYSVSIYGCTSLTTINIPHNALTFITIKNTPALTTLNVPYNKLERFDDDYPALTALDISHNNFYSIDFHFFPVLKYLNCSHNNLEYMTAGCFSLETLDCSHNQFQTFGIPDCRETLVSLTLSNNDSLDCLFLSNFPNLKYLDITKCNNLENLDINTCAIKSLDLSESPELTNLTCHHNQLSSLDVTDCHNLQFINCTNNHLSFIDLPKEFTGGIDCDSNHIPLSVLANLLKQCEGATFDPQLMALPPLPIGQTLDLRSEMQGSDYNVEYTMYLDSTEVDNRFYTIRNGLFAFHKAGNYRVKLSSSLSLGMNTILMPGSVYYDLTVVDSIARPTFSVPSGKVKRGTTVSLNTTTPNASIIYTTDGSEPDNNALEYTEPIRITEAMTIKAVAIYKTLKSQVSSASYTIDSVANEHDLKASNLRVYAKDRTIYLSETVGEVEVFTVRGTCVYHGYDTAIPVKQSGIYIVSANGRRWKVAVR